MKPLKFVFAWLLFAISFFIFSFFVYKYFPEKWLFNIVKTYHPHFIGESLWDSIFVSTTLLLTLVINIGFIFLTFTIIKVSRRIKYSSDA